MRRKPGALLPLEQSILGAALDLRRNGEGEFYGYLLAQRLKQQAEARRLVSFGTLYKALDRLEAAGLVESRWEEAPESARSGRPRRRLYRLTAAGDTAASALPVPARGDIRALPEGASA